jgi:pseudo-rSAM protein
VLIDFPLNKEKLKEAQTLLKQSNVDSTFQFIVEGEKDVEGAEHAISQNNIEKFGFSPYFNGNNTSFFKKNVFIDREDILSSSPSMNEIFARMTLNRFNVGTITIFSNTDIYANVNHSKLGKLGEKDLFLFIARELRYGKSWARIRKNVSPCKRCVFNTLCPPITNYEYALGYYNLCHIMKETNG